jgi:predicted SnoaL-like aldol condensation-catalyzing enzyme
MRLIKAVGRQWFGFLALLVMLAFPMAAPMSRAELAAPSDNKKLVVAYYTQVFVKKQVKEGFDAYVVEDYIQHNPRVPDGREAAVKFLGEMLRNNPQRVAEIKHVLADGDLVMLHVHAKANPEDRGMAIVDIFRVSNGKIVEHWDVVQPVPEAAANKNTMF